MLCYLFRYVILHFFFNISHFYAEIQIIKIKMQNEIKISNDEKIINVCYLLILVSVRFLLLFVSACFFDLAEDVEKRQKHTSINVRNNKNLNMQASPALGIIKRSTIFTRTPKAKLRKICSFLFLSLLFFFFSLSSESPAFSSSSSTTSGQWKGNQGDAVEHHFSLFFNNSS